MATTSPDDVALLKQELAQFLLAEITSTEGAATFRQEVSSEVGAVIDKILNERLTPALTKLQNASDEHARSTTATLEAALARLEDEVPGVTVSPDLEKKLGEIATRVDELRARVVRVEEKSRATAQPLAVPPREAKPANDDAAVRNAAPPWVTWVLLALSIIAVFGVANLYLERLMAPTPSTATTTPVFTPPAANTTSPAAITPNTTTPHVSVPPQTTPAIPPATTTPSPTTTVPTPTTTTPPAPTPHASIPADFAIERGWIAAQPFAVDARLARKAGAGDSITTLKSLVCGRGQSCASDTLVNEASGIKQVIALQMVMSQIGDRFCTPRRSVSVNGSVTAAGLADLAAITRCAERGPKLCVETNNRVCPPDANAITIDPESSRGALLRWALWKIGST